MWDRVRARSAQLVRMLWKVKRETSREEKVEWGRCTPLGGRDGSMLADVIIQSSTAEVERFAWALARSLTGVVLSSRSVSGSVRPSIKLLTGLLLPSPGRPDGRRSPPAAVLLVFPWIERLLPAAAVGLNDDLHSRVKPAVDSRLSLLDVFCMVLLWPYSIPKLPTLSDYYFLSLLHGCDAV